MNQTASRAKSIFLDAIELPDNDQRSAFVAAQCADDVALRHDIDRLLRDHGGLGSFMQSADANDPSDGSPSEEAPITEQPGTVIGPYKLLEQIGEGGMGVVYMAEQSEPVARRVALKIIKPGMDSRQVIARFEAERQALAMMDHPNVSKVLDAGTTESGRPFFVMELVKGVSITQYCDEHKLSVRQRLELFVPVCQAIQHAHQKGIIHRDIKPSNVMVAQYDDRAVPKIIDFGVAKATEQRLTEKTVFTQFGQIVGTFEYMSPEQAKLNQLDIDTRSDVYSLGVLLYELLTGETPFDGERLRSAAFDELLRIIREEDPPRPSLRLSTSGTLPETASNRQVEPKRLSSLVRGELDWIVMKALEKDRSRRYETATALGADVEHYLADEPVEACPPSSVYMIGKFTRRNKAWLSTAAAVLITVIVGLTVSTLLIARERDAAEESARREATAAKEADRRLDDAKYNLYVSHTRLAREDWKEGQVSRMVETLQSHIPAPGERDLRGWEWYYLMSLSQRDLATLSPDIGPITNVKWSADRRYLAAAGDIIQVYDAVTNEPRFQIPGGRQFAWSPEGHELAVTSTAGEFSVWDADQQKQTRKIGEAKDGFPWNRKTITWSPDGTRITLSIHQRLFVWPADGSGDSATFDLDKRVRAKCVDWHPAGRLISIGGRFPGWVQVWDVQKGESVLVERWHGHKVTDVAWSPDGTLLATAGMNKHIYLRDTKDWKLVRELEGVQSNPHDLCWSPNAKHLAAASVDGRVALWDVETGELQSYLRGHRGPILALDWSADGEQVVTGSRDGTIKIWAPFGSQEYQEPDLDGHAIWSPDGDQIAGVASSASPAGRHLSIVEAQSGESVNEFPLPGFTQGLDFSPDGAKIAGAFGGGSVAVWEAGGPEQLWVEPDAHHPTNANVEARCVAWSPDGRVLASCGTGRTVKLWDGTSGALLRTLKGHEYELGAVIWSPDGRRMASTDWRGHVKIWNTNTWAVEHELMRSPSSSEETSIDANSVDGHRPIAYSSDGRRLAGGGLAGIIYIWDADSGRELLQLRGHTGNIRSVAWTPDGRRLASGSEDGLVKIWDTTSGREMLTLRGHRVWVDTVDWSPDGRRLLTSSDEVKLWDATSAYEAFGPLNQTSSETFDPGNVSRPPGTETVLVVNDDTPGEADTEPADGDADEPSPDSNN